MFANALVNSLVPPVAQHWGHIDTPVLMRACRRYCLAISVAIRSQHPFAVLPHVRILISYLTMQTLPDTRWPVSPEPKVTHRQGFAIVMTTRISIRMRFGIVYAVCFSIFQRIFCGTWLLLNPVTKSGLQDASIFPLRSLSDVSHLDDCTRLSIHHISQLNYAMT